MNVAKHNSVGDKVGQEGCSYSGRMIEKGCLAGLSRPVLFKPLCGQIFRESC